MEIYIEVNGKKYKSKIHKYHSLHRAILNTYTSYNPETYTIYYKNKVQNHKESIEKCNIHENDIIHIVPKLKGGYEIPQSTAKSGAMIFIMVLISLSPIYFMYIGIVPLKSFLSRRIMVKALEPLGKYLVCMLGKKTLYRRILLLTSIIKYFIFIFAVFVTFTLAFIALCVMMKGQSIFDSPENLTSPVNAGYVTGTIFTVIHMLTYLGYRWFDYFADFFISIFRKYYYTKMIFVPILESLKGIFNRIKGIGVTTATMGFASDAKMVYGPMASSAAATMEKIAKTIIPMGCEAVGVDEIEEEFKSTLKGMKKSDLVDFEIKGRDRKKFCFDFNEYLDDNEFEKLCSPNNNLECCTSSKFYNIALGLFGAITNSSVVGELLKQAAGQLGMMGHLITANIAFFEESMNMKDDLNEAEKDGFYVPEKTYVIQKDYSKEKIGSLSVKEKDIDEMIEKLKTQGYRTLTLYDERYKDDKKDIVGVLNVKRKVFYDDIKSNILQLRRMLNDYGANYDDDDVMVKNVFKPYFIENVCEILNGTRAVKDLSEEVRGLDNVVDMLVSGMLTGRWMIVLFLITYIVLVVLSFFKVY